MKTPKQILNDCDHTRTDGEASPAFGPCRRCADLAVAAVEEKLARLRALVVEAAAQEWSEHRLRFPAEVLWQRVKREAMARGLEQPVDLKSYGMVARAHAARALAAFIRDVDGQDGTAGSTAAVGKIELSGKRWSRMLSMSNAVLHEEADECPF